MPKPQFQEVMTAGFKQWPVGKLVDAGKPKARVVLTRPPTQEDGREAMTKFHNMLVDLCQVSLRQCSHSLSHDCQRDQDTDDIAIDQPGGGE